MWEWQSINQYNFVLALTEPWPFHRCVAKCGICSCSVLCRLLVSLFMGYKASARIMGSLNFHRVWWVSRQGCSAVTWKYQPSPLLSYCLRLCTSGGCAIVCSQFNIWTGKAGLCFFCYCLALWCAQIIELFINRWSYWFVCSLHYPITIIRQTCLKILNLLQCFLGTFCRVCVSDQVN